MDESIRARLNSVVHLNGIVSNRVHPFELMYQDHLIEHLKNETAKALPANSFHINFYSGPSDFLVHP